MTSATPVFRLYIVRHGRTSYNAQSLLAGKLDIPLSAYGIAQSSHSSALFSTIPIHGTITSTLLRAKQTADIILESHIGVGVVSEARVEDGRLDERGLGEWEGKRVEEVGWVEEPEGAETFDEVSTRVSSFLTSLLSSFNPLASSRGTIEPNNILLVTHKDIITSFARLFSFAAKTPSGPEWRIPTSTVPGWRVELDDDVELLDGCSNLGVGSLEGFRVGDGDGDQWVLKIRAWAKEAPVV
ncbi:hypothetical protein L198_02523 [Cryptococcus wingfieldii CBS 7118]|uniref:Phosphoglycerate mutase n=1 Tax=Cryptococcus wingfieldii CBS 7118 TaxID=1295528 RepID=A0A1E3JLR9_9TREE|nr:hypothetical protein L198_02523 [Cryptococcus wingfieldii CBS 7118]ODO01798.1 hypothetical protein L198_02523 [Cryptococcus wingfieldii CBS 7118]